MSYREPAPEPPVCWAVVFRFSLREPGGPRSVTAVAVTDVPVTLALPTVNMRVINESRRRAAEQSGLNTAQVDVEWFGLVAYTEPYET